MPEPIENKMVINHLWECLERSVPDEVREKLKQPGYTEIGTNIFVPERNAFDFAIERILGGTEEEKEEFIEWFYSGNWIKEE